MKQILSAFLIAILFTSQLNAQDYKTGIGFRGGTQSGLTIKHFLSEFNAVEGIFATRWGGLYSTGLYERIGPYFDVPGFHWYYGLGAHVGFIDGNNNRFEDEENHTLAGVDFIFGLEYKFENAPVVIGLDWKPQLDLIGDMYYVLDDLAFSVRYTFSKKPSR